MRLEPELRTERVGGGGRNSRVSLIAVAGVLTAVVGVAVLARPSAPAPPPSGSAAAIVQPTRSPAVTQLVSPTPPAPSSTSTPLFAPVPAAHGSVAGGEDAFGLIAVIDDQLYLEILEEVEPGHLVGSMWVSVFAHPQGARLELVQLWTLAERRHKYVRVGAWDLPLADAWRDHSLTALVVDESVEPRRRARRKPRPVREGYTIRVQARSGDQFVRLLADIQLGPTSDPVTR